MSRPCSRNVLWPSLRIAYPGRRGLRRLGRDMAIAGAFLAVTELRMSRLEPHRDFSSSPPLWVAKFHEGEGRTAPCTLSSRNSRGAARHRLAKTHPRASRASQPGCSDHPDPPTIPQRPWDRGAQSRRAHLRFFSPENKTKSDLTGSTRNSLAAPTLALIRGLRETRPSLPFQPRPSRYYNSLTN
jgi:hypothetical protein